MEKKIEAVLATSSPPACNAQLLSAAEAMREACTKAIWHRSSADEAVRLVRKIDAAAIIAALPAAAPQVVADELPELPEPHWKRNGSYSMEQMMTYAHAALAAAPAQVQELDHGDTVLRIQAALGCTDGGWISPDVILLRIEQLKASIDSWRNVPAWAKPGSATVQPVAVPDGWKLVPIYPTNMMLQNADANPIWKKPESALVVTAEKAWRNMLAVSPKPPIAAPAAQGDAKELMVEDLYRMYQDSYSKLNCEVDPFDTLDEMEQKAWRNLAVAIAAKAAS